MGRGQWWSAAVALCVVGLAGCAGSDSPSPAADRASDAVALATEPATQRGVAAAVTTHLDADLVGEVAIGADVPDDGPLFVAVDTGDPDLGALVVRVLPPGSSLEPTKCGTVPDDRPLSCSTEPVLREIVATPADGAGSPSVVGQRGGDGRGGLVVRVDGADGPAAQALVGDLLDDPLLGWETTPQLNAAGARLDLREVTEWLTTETTPR